MRARDEVHLHRLDFRGEHHEIVVQPDAGSFDVDREASRVWKTMRSIAPATAVLMALRFKSQDPKRHANHPFNPDPPWQLCSRRRGGDDDLTRVPLRLGPYTINCVAVIAYRRHEPFKSQTSSDAHGSNAYSVEYFSCTPPLAQRGCLIPPVAPICEARDDSQGSHYFFQKSTRTIAFVPKWQRTTILHAC